MAIAPRVGPSWDKQMTDTAPTLGRLTLMIMLALEERLEHQYDHEHEKKEEDGSCDPPLPCP